MYVHHSNYLFSDISGYRRPRRGPSATITRDNLYLRLTDSSTMASQHPPERAL